MNIFSFIGNFFKKATFPLGVIQSPSDNRTVTTAAFIEPVDLPDDFNTILPQVEMQDGEDCVGFAIAKGKEYDLEQAGTPVPLSGKSLYDQCKLIDGIATPGTVPLIGVKLAISSGINSKAVYESSTDENVLKSDRAKYKFKGFASVNPDFDSVCQALFKSKWMVAAFAVDANWFMGIITRVLKALGRHYIILHGFNRTKKIIRAQNSWGIKWIGAIAGMINPTIQPGHLNILWSDVVETVSDLYIFTEDIPDAIITHIKSLNYFFGSPMKYGQNSYDILQLQKRLDSEGYWDKAIPFSQRYGDTTAKYVLMYQLAKGIVITGAESFYGKSVGSKTLADLNGRTGLDFTNALIKQESGGNDYAVGDIAIPISQGGPAYGCLQIRQGVVDEVNKRLLTSFKSKDCLGNRERSLQIFDCYFNQIHTEMKTDHDKALCWNGGPGWKQLYGRKGYENYTKSLDAYWASVSKMLK